MDLNGDGTLGDATVAQPTYTYSTPGTYTAVLRVTDSLSASTTSSPITITVLAGGSNTFGTSSPGALVDSASTDLKEVSKYTAPQAGNVFKLTGYVSGLGASSGSQPVRAVVYADSGGDPGALLGVSNAVTINANQAWGWVDFTFPSQVPVSAGPVWMGYIAGSTADLAQLRYTSTPGECHYNWNPGGYAAGPSNPFGSFVLTDKHYSLYASYVPSGGGNTPPIASATASPTSGTAPLTVNFDGSGSSDPDGNPISYSWDLNGDGTFGDSTVTKPTYTYSAAGTYTARLKVTDSLGASTTSSPVTITVAAGGGTATFGTTTPGTLVDTASADFKEASQYTAAQAVSVLKVTGYVSGLGAASGTQPVRAVIYSDSSGAPASLLGVSNAVNITAGRAWGWVDFTFPSPVAVGPGTVWIGYIAGSPSNLTQLRYASSTGELRWNVNPGGYAAGPSSPFGAGNTSNLHYSLYATYSTSSNGPPVPSIQTPLSSLTWKVGDLITFSGSAVDTQDGALPASGLSWSIILHHCDPTGQTCHDHPLQTFAGVAGGSFNAPDHGYPSHLELRLTATDSQGLTGTTSVTIEPQPVNLTFTSAPSGMQVVVDSTSQTTPFTMTAIIGSTHSVSAVTPQTLGGTTYTFGSWSDGGAATHNLTAPATATTYTASYTSPSNSPPVAVATASPTSGTAPLLVNFDGSGSSDPNPGDTISYSWDLNGDGTFGDSTVAKPSSTYAAPGTYNAVLKVTDSHGASTLSAPITITATSPSNSPPVAVATASPTSGTAPLLVNFDGSGSSDPNAGDTISYSWDLNGDGTFGDSTVAKPSSTYAAPGTYNAVLKVTDSHGASTLSAPITITVAAGVALTFGTTTPGPSSDTADANYKLASKFTAPQAGNVVKVTGYVSGLAKSSGSQVVRAIFYANNAGAPGALLGVSNEVTIAARRPWGWVDFTFQSPVAIPAGTVWIGYISGSTNKVAQFRYSQINNDSQTNVNTYASGPSNPFGSASSGARHYSIYATYG